MKVVNTKNMLTAKNDGIKYLEDYIKTNDELYLQKAIESDNTNSKTIYYYLENIKNKDQRLYQEELDKYKLLIKEEHSNKMNIQKNDHKKDCLEILHTIQNIDIKNINLGSLKNLVEKFIPPKDHENFTIKGKRINNIPLDLDDEFLYYLSLKMEIADKLYDIIINAKISENEEEKKYQIDAFEETISYLKVIVEIVLFYLQGNKKDIVYNLWNIIDLTERQSIPIDNQIKYNLNKIGKTMAQISKETCYKFLTSDFHVSDIDIFVYKFESYKSFYFTLMEKILKSNCITDLIIKMKEYHRDINNIIKIDNNFINFIKKNTIFYSFIRLKSFGITNVRELKTLINIDFRGMDIPYNCNILFLFCVLIITGLHEYIGHLLKDYYYYSTNFSIFEQSPKKKKKDESQFKNKELESEKGETKEERKKGCEIVEEFLFNKITDISFRDVIYILDLSNWEKSLDEFAQYFKSEERKKLLNSEQSIKIDPSPNVLEILSIFNIKKLDLFFIRDNDLMTYKNYTSIPLMKYNVGCGTHKKTIKNLFDLLNKSNK